jgi:hypothetical protein
MSTTSKPGNHGTGHRTTHHPECDNCVTRKNDVMYVFERVLFNTSIPPADRIELLFQTTTLIPWWDDLSESHGWTTPEARQPK